MTDYDESLAKLNFLLELSESRPLTKDEIEAVFDMTRKRIQRLEKKAVDRLRKLKESKENAPNPEDASAGSDKSQSNGESD